MSKEEVLLFDVLADFEIIVVKCFDSHDVNSEIIFLYIYIIFLIKCEYLYLYMKWRHKKYTILSVFFSASLEKYVITTHDVDISIWI